MGRSIPSRPHSLAATSWRLHGAGPRRERFTPLFTEGVSSADPSSQLYAKVPLGHRNPIPPWGESGISASSGTWPVVRGRSPAIRIRV